MKENYSMFEFTSPQDIYKPFDILAFHTTLFTKKNVPSYGAKWKDLSATTAKEGSSHHKILEETLCIKALRVGVDLRDNRRFVYCPSCMMVLGYAK